MKIKAPAPGESAEKDLIVIFFIYRDKKSPALADFTGFPVICADLSSSNGQILLSIREKDANTAILSLFSTGNMIKKSPYRTNSHKIFSLKQKYILLSAPYSTARIQRHYGLKAGMVSADS